MSDHLLTQSGLNEALNLAVGFRRVRFGTNVLGPAPAGIAEAEWKSNGADRLLIGRDLRECLKLRILSFLDPDRMATY